jgi:uncharacterized protein (DUF433 family)
MNLTLHADPVPLRLDETGALRVGQSRVTLDVLLQYWRMGMRPEEIARGLETLTLADVLGALAYYARHQDELDEYLCKREVEAEQLHKLFQTVNASQFDALKTRMDALRAKGNGGHASASD